jgi:inner membrane protein
VPSILSHPAVPLALGVALGSRAIPPRLLLAGVAAAIVPDIDVYIASFGHRGITHTPVAALLAGLCAALVACTLHTTRTKAFLFVFAAMLSHPLLDMLTNGGSGIPIFWPFSEEGYFFPVTPIEVSPLGVGRFFSARGLDVLRSEAVWIWLPAAVACALLRLARRMRSRGSGG